MIKNYILILATAIVAATAFIACGDATPAKVEEALTPVPFHQVTLEDDFWLSTILLNESSPVSADELRQRLATHGIETRLLWRPMHMQAIYQDAPAYVNGVSEDLFNRGLCLPSSTTLSDEEIAFVAQLINQYTTGA